MKNIITFILIIGSISAFSQKYPIPIRTGDTLKIIRNEAAMSIGVTDTLWIMKNSQLQNALIKAKELELCNEETTEYKNLVNLLKEQGSEKDSLNIILKKDRDYYQGIWKTCDEDVVKMGKLQKRQSLYTKLALLGIPIAFVIGLFITI